MWDEAKPVEVPKEDDDNQAGDDKWWEKKDEEPEKVAEAAPVSDDPAEQYADQPVEGEEEAANEDAAMEDASESAGVKRPLEEDDDEAAPAAKAPKTEGDDADVDQTEKQLNDGSGNKL